MKVTELALPGVLFIEPRHFMDGRGYFLETYQERRYGDFDIPARFVQDNLSFSRHGVVRGLHYQLHQPQGKLVMVLQGEVFDVVVDIRLGSPTFGVAASKVLSAAGHHQLYVPPGYAHGFVVLSDAALFHYKCTDYYNPGDEYGIRWNDPDLGIAWPVAEAVLSDRDRHFPLLRDAPPEHLPIYHQPLSP
ncbi:MAG: dTDP-4-dehydrorhamnose 3,5-epimerase [Deltaproteobacteria bacterium]|nr:dTDP-4-dehydrorhamnose 3,5-epimerase [Deltaproteobacteria bacterium]